MEKFSKNAKLNKVLNEIYNELLSIHDTERESIEEIEHYKKEFPRELDYNLYQYGNLLIYNNDIVALYSEYRSLKNASVDKLVAIYKRQVRYIADYILRNNK